jgi:hypothetical protein
MFRQSSLQFIYPKLFYNLQAPLIPTPISHPPAAQAILKTPDISKALYNSNSFSAVY